MTLEKSLQLQARAMKFIPGMTQLLSKRPDRFSFGAWPAYFSRAKGVEVWDLDGNRYLDMSISGIGACILGYADPEVDEAVVRAITDGVTCSLNCPEEVELAELLCELHPWAEMVRYTRSGGEAMAVAVRIARAFTNRDKVAFCGYHGWHDWYLAANLGTEDALGNHLISGLSPRGVPRGLCHTAFPFRYNRIDELEKIVRLHGTDLAAIVMEPIRDHEPEKGFIEGVKSLAEDAGAVLVMDEISAGFRLCTGGAHLVVHPVSPDLAVFSKAMGNGYAISAVIGREKVMQAAQKTFISSTNWTERIGPAAALATIRKHREQNVAAHLIRIGGQVQEGWRQSAKHHGLSIKVSGLLPMGHFAFEDPAGALLKAYFIQLMLDKGFLASTLFYAMAAHTREHAEAYLAAVEDVFAQIRSVSDGNELEGKLRGKPASSDFGRLT
jgi:glutamate-1-semialdehyde 2,1-aminomutase